MKKLIFAAALVLAPAVAQAAPSMTVADYLQRRDALVRNGQGPATREYQRLRDQLWDADRLARAERRIARSENRAPRACLRPGVSATNSDEITQHLRSIPAAEAQTITVADAYMQLMARKFPCRNS